MNSNLLFDFKEGLGTTLENLDGYLKAQFQLRQQNKTDHKAKVCSYLNFDGKTKEAARLFHELSAGGNVTMPMADMFFGAYFEEFSDKYRINWMINFQN